MSQELMNKVEKSSLKDEPPQFEIGDTKRQGVPQRGMPLLERLLAGEEVTLMDWLIEFLCMLFSGGAVNW